MRGSKESDIRRIAAGIIGLMMLVIVLFSAFYIAAEANHDCTGEDCLICSCIQQCENTLRGIGGGTSGQSSAIIPFLFVSLAALFTIAAAPNTLISQKIRLNN